MSGFMAVPHEVLHVAWKGGYVRSAVGTITVGRDPTCDVILCEDVSVSRRHALFQLLPSAIKLEDLGSRNGTFVEGRQLTSAALLSGGEWIRVGSTELRAFRSEHAFRQAVLAATPVQTIPPDPDGSISTITTNVFANLLQDVARIGLSRPEEVPVLIDDALSVAERVAASGQLSEGDGIIVAEFALREALSKHDGSWVRRVIRVYASARRVMPVEIARRIVAARGKVEGFPEEEVGTYIAVLATLSPAVPHDRQRLNETVRLLTEEQR